MSDYYKRLEPLGSAAHPAAKTVFRTASSKQAPSRNQNVVPVPKPRPTQGQRLKRIAQSYGLNIPDDVDFDRNIAISKNRDIVPFDFYQRVDYGGDWDYKKRPNSDYQDFGNYHFGAMARAAGFPKETILRMAGWAHQKHQGKASFLGIFPAALGIGGEPPYGDEPRDQYWIIKGIDDYDGINPVDDKAIPPNFTYYPY